MNLHEWISGKLDEVEAEHRSVVFVPDDGSKPITGAITDAMYTADGFQLTVRPGRELTAAVLRRCEADRRVLARHRLPESGDWMYPGCEGCGTTGEFDDIVTDNINECPELLDLAHAHGITDDELATLDSPQTTPRPPVPPGGQLCMDFYRALLDDADRPPLARMTAEQVPASLRGYR